MKTLQVVLFSCACLLAAYSPLQVKAAEENNPAMSMAKELLSGFEKAGNLNTTMEAIGAFANALVKQMAPNEPAAEVMKTVGNELFKQANERQSIMEKIDATAATMQSGVTTEEENQILQKQIDHLKEEYDESVKDTFKYILKVTGTSDKGADEFVKSNPLVPFLMSIIHSAAFDQLEKN